MRYIQDKIIYLCIVIGISFGLLAWNNSKQIKLRNEISRLHEAYNDSISKVDSITWSVKTIELRPSDASKILDSVNRPKDLVVYVKTTMVLRDTITLIKKDSLLSFIDKSVSLEVNPVTNKAIIAVSISPTLTIKQDRWKLFGKQRKWLPRKKTFTTELISNDQRISVTKLKVLLIK